MSHVVLLGDSIFDNRAYTLGEPDVAAQLRGFLPRGWSVTLLAIDGSTTLHIPDQLSQLPKAASHLVLSVGGNNALTEASRLGLGLFGPPDAPAMKGLASMADLFEEFEAAYSSCADACLRPGLPLTVCTIYNGYFPDRSYQRVASLALTIFNDVILRVAIARSLPVIDLRLICTAPDDYANPIEPSSIGGRKIAKVIADLLAETPAHASRTRIFRYS
jgi:GDSL-like Lipase/Acylhydrolase family